MKTYIALTTTTLIAFMTSSFGSICPFGDTALPCLKDSACSTLGLFHLECHQEIREFCLTNEGLLNEACTNTFDGIVTRNLSNSLKSSHSTRRRVQGSSGMSGSSGSSGASGSEEVDEEFITATEEDENADKRESGPSEDKGDDDSIGRLGIQGDSSVAVVYTVLVMAVAQLML